MAEDSKGRGKQEIDLSVSTGERPGLVADAVGPELTPLGLEEQIRRVARRLHQRGLLRAAGRQGDGRRRT